MRTTKDLKIIAIEGGDFTGKSTQAKMLAENLDGLNIVIHFPRVNLNPKVKEIYNKTSNVLYNMDFWLNEFKPLIENKFIDYLSIKESSTYTKILDVLNENVGVNHVDKILFIKDLQNLIYKNVEIPYLADICEIIYYNHEEVSIETVSTNKFLNKSIGNTKVNIILDRFSISGYVYNQCIPIAFLLDIKEKHILNEELSKKEYEIRDNLMKSLVQSIVDHQYLADNELAKILNELFDDSEDHINWKSVNRINPKFVNIKLINTNEELISKMNKDAKTDTNRKFDEYDKNIFIQKTANEFFIGKTKSDHNYFAPDMSIYTIDIGSKECYNDQLPDEYIKEHNIRSVNVEIIKILENHENEYVKLCETVSRFI